MDVIDDVERQLRELRQLPVAQPPTVGTLARRGQQRRAKQRVAVGVGAAALVGLSLIGLIIDTTKEDMTAVQVVGAPTTASPEATAQEDATISALMAFAFRSTDDTFADLPFADEVRLGVEDRIVITRPGADLRDPDSWVVDGRSALDELATGGGYVVTTDGHRTCDGDDLPRPPQALAGYRRVSIQPPEPEYDTCLTWQSVDLYLDDAGRIAGVTLTLWED